MSPRRDRPLVTIGLPVRNGEARVGEAIESVLAQKLGDLELVISDNASTDGTARLCRTYAGHDPRVRYTTTDRPVGAVPNFNRLVGLARGRYFKWISHDDVLAPELLRRAVEALERRPSVVLCHWNETIVDDDGRVLRSYGHDQRFAVEGSTPVERFRQLLWAGRRGSRGDPLYGLVRTDVLERSRLLEQTLHPNMLLLQELSLRGRFHTIPETLAVRRYNDQRTTVPRLLPWLGREGARIRLPHLRHVRDYLQLVHRTDLLTDRERLRLQAETVAFFLGPWHWRGYAWDLLRGAWILGGDLDGRAVPAAAPGRR